MQRQDITTRLARAAAKLSLAQITPPVLYNTQNVNRLHFSVSRLTLLVVLMLFTTATAWAGDVTVTSSTTNWTNGNTYNVTSDVTINDASISVSGSVTLNLGAGTTLTLNQGIEINGGNWLTITGDGTLIVHGPNGADADVGVQAVDGDTGVNGNLIINSGTVTITGGNGGDATPYLVELEGSEEMVLVSAGDGGDGAPGVKGDIIVNGGTVTVTGGNGGRAGMEYGDDWGYGGHGIDGSLTLNGGTATIIGGEGEFSINGMGITGDITLAGGTLVFPNDNSRYSWAFDYDSNVMIADGYIYKYIYENSVGYLTGSLNDDQKINLYDKPLTLLPVQFAGEGTEADPYLITSYNDLLNLRDFVNSGTPYDGKYFKQTANIDWPANTTWTSGIGTDADHRFGGHYDGDGKAIRRLTISGTSTNTGLFGYVCGADNHQGGRVLTTLKNIVLEDCNIDASSVSNSYASGICASIYANSSTRIDNCRVSGTISGTSHASGIICNISYSTYVTNCFADVTVSAPHKGKIFAEFSTLYGNDRIVGNYYHDNGDGVGSNGNSYNLTSSQVAPLYTVSSTSLTTAATNATVTHAGTHYFAAGATATLTTDGNHIISGTPTVSGAGASLGSVASDKKSMTLTVGTADVTVSATLVTVTGTCGTNATWSLAQDGSGNYTILTISGTGAMQDYYFTTVNSLWRTTAPWGWQTLTSVTIGDGITAIGDYAFCGCQQLGNVTIGNSVTNIGYASINHCDALTELTLPASVASIEAGAFQWDINLTRLNIQKTDGLVTLENNDIFYQCSALQTIVVPTPALAVQYQAAQYWSTHATKLRVPFGSQLFTATNEGGTAAYEIANATDWNNLAIAVNGGANGSGQTFRQTANITVSNFTPIGSSEANSFRGTYDGGSKTLTFNYGDTDSYANEQSIAPFSYINNVGSEPATIRNLCVAGHIYTSAKYAAGIAAQTYGTVNIENCRSSITIHSSISGDGTHGGLVSQIYPNGTLTISGCVFDGKLLTTNGTTNCGGFVGYNGGTTSISNSLYAPNVVEGETWVSTDGSATFVRNASAGTNCYYTRALGTAQGKAPRTVTAGENVTIEAVSPVGSPVENGTYSVSGITAYATGITRTVGQATTFYYGSDDNVSVTLSHDRAGYTFNSYTPSAGTLNGTENPYMLTMPGDGDVNINATWTPITYSITYNLNGGSLTTDKNSYTIESEAITLDEPTRTGYTFAGWYTNEGLTGDPVTTIAHGSTEDKTFWAKWTINTYTITYYPNDGTFTTDKNSYTIESEDITLDVPTRTGYTFGGWYNNEALEGDAVTTIAHGSTEDMTFWAKWTANTYSITYNLNGGELTTDKNSYTIESEAITLDEPTREHFIFGGWYESSDFSDNAVTTIAHGSTGNKTFYAKWLVPYIDANGDTQACFNYTVLTNETDLSDALYGGWYIVDGTVSYNSRTIFNGDLHLILCDGAKMMIENTYSAIDTNGNLTIYAQSTGSNMGQLEVTSSEDSGIRSNTGNVTICGGNITAIGKNGNGLSGIEANYDVTIHSGQVSANGHIGIYSNRGSINLGLRNANDFIYASSYVAYGTVKVADGQALYYEEGGTKHALTGTLTDGDISTIAGKTLKHAPCIVLADNADNSTTISDSDGEVATVTLQGRTLYKDGDWNTLCLPFNVTAEQIAETTHPLHGATIKQLNATTSNLDTDGTLTLNFTTAYDPTNAPDGSIEAGTPYIVKWDTPGDNITDPTFPGVTISSTTPTAVEFDIAGSSDKCQFVGQYSPFSITDENKNEILMLGSGSKLGYSNNARSLKCFRAHFYVPADQGQQAARSFVMDFGEGSAETGILTVTAAAPSATGIFTLDGRRISGQPTEKGVYIVNGKKVIIK